MTIGDDSAPFVRHLFAVQKIAARLSILNLQFFGSGFRGPQLLCRQIGIDTAARGPSAGGFDIGADGSLQWEQLVSGARQNAFAGQSCFDSALRHLLSD